MKRKSICHSVKPAPWKEVNKMKILHSSQNSPAQETKSIAQTFKSLTSWYGESHWSSVARDCDITHWSRLRIWVFYECITSGQRSLTDCNCSIVPGNPKWPHFISTYNMVWRCNFDLFSLLSSPATQQKISYESRRKWTASISKIITDTICFCSISYEFCYHASLPFQLCERDITPDNSLTLWDCTHTSYSMVSRWYLLLR
jgi:hypothetical protein